MIEGVIVTNLPTVHHPKGNINHVIKTSSKGFEGFGEAYFSSVDCGSIKGWKRHNRIALNVVVPIGAIRFVIYDDRQDSTTYGEFFELTIGLDCNYSRLTIPSGLWVSFQGIGESNMLLNIIAEEHDPSESTNLPLNDISYSW